MKNGLSDHQLTTLLRLAFRAAQEQSTPLPPREEPHRFIHGGPDTGAFKGFLAALANEERKDVMGYYYLGRGAFDTFASARQYHGNPLEVIPHVFSEKLDVASCVVAGLKRMADMAPRRAHLTGAPND
jgi:hypothetical protein